MSNPLQSLQSLSTTQWRDHDEEGLETTFTKEYTRLFPRSAVSSSSSHSGSEGGREVTIPQFYFSSSDGRVSAEKSARVGLLKREARLRFLGREIEGLAQGSVLDAVWGELMEGAGAVAEGEQEGGGAWIGYDAYAMVASALEAYGAAVAGILVPSGFYSFAPREDGKIRVEDVFEYVVGVASLRKMRIMLSAHDQEGSGFLSETDLERFIVQSVQDLPVLASLDQTFHVFYVCTAVRKFFFFLDPMRLGRISIKSILLSPVLSELFELEELDENGELDPSNPNGGELEPSGLARNWFTPKSARRVYADYLALDVDHNGMLSRDELRGYGTGTLTSAFLDRVFEECHTYGGEMDYKTYLDFVLAMENKSSPEALAFFFRLLDIHECGALTSFTIRYFFKAVQTEMVASGYYPAGSDVRIEDVQSEIFDMVAPSDPYRITLQDLIRSHRGATVVNILTDVSGFWCYDNREMLVAADDSE